MEIIIGWFIFSIVAGYIGSDRKIGFFTSFFLSLILSPLIGFLIAFNSPKIRNISYEDEVINILIESGHRKFEDKQYDDALADFLKISSMGRKSPNTNFHIACIYALKGKREEALFHLSKAVEQGYVDFDKIKSKEELSFLRKQKEFSEFISNGYKLTTIKDDKDMVEKLERIAKLYKEGFLTMEEFEQQKKNILTT